MFEGAFSPMHWLMVLLIAHLVFGPRRLPEIGKGLGSAIRGFRDAIGGRDEAKAEPRPGEAAPLPEKSEARH